MLTRDFHRSPGLSLHCRVELPSGLDMNKHLKFRLPIVVLWILLAFAMGPFRADAESESSVTNSLTEPDLNLDRPGPSVWHGGIGEGFLRSVQTVSVEVGVAPGMATFGSRQAHDFALMNLSYGHMLSDVMWQDHWYRGNFEGRIELFGGAQYRPSTEYVIGLTPHLRYDFATGTRWVPFIDGGAGVTATSIGPPDMCGTFEFNLQTTAGTHFFVRNDLALTAEASYMHMSCAGIHHPNLGANNVIFMIGLTWFFGK